MGPVLVLVGALSVYHAGDGMNSGELACGGRLEPTSSHVAIRQWRGLCGARALVCSLASGRCVRTRVRDSGPWGQVCGGTWSVNTRSLERGCRRRAVADLTRALWAELGRPPFLSPIVVTITREKEPTS